jgi:hypothetical protein
VKLITARHKTIRRFARIAELADQAIRDTLDRPVADAAPVFRKVSTQLFYLSSDLMSDVE